MKKLLALMMAMMMTLSLAACGSEDSGDTNVSSSSSSAAVDDVESEETEEPDDSANVADNSEAEISDEQLQALVDAYNQAAPLFNEAYTAADENGWMADEQTAAEIEAVNGTLGVIGQALTEDLTMLDGSDYDALTDAVLQLVPELEKMVERVSVPYEG